MKESFSLKKKEDLFVFLFCLICFLYVIYAYFLSENPYHIVGSVHNYLRLVSHKTFSTYAKNFPYSIGLKLQSYFFYKYFNFNLLKFKILSSFFSFGSLVYGFYLMKKFFGGWISSFALVFLLLLSGWFDFAAGLGMIPYSARTFLSFVFLHIFLVLLTRGDSLSFLFIFLLSLFLSFSLFLHYSLLPQFFSSCVFLLACSFFSQGFFKKDRIRSFISYLFIFCVGMLGFLIFYFYFRHPEIKKPREIIHWLFFLKSGYFYTYSDITSFLIFRSKTLVDSVFSVDFQENGALPYSRWWLSCLSYGSLCSSFVFLFFSLRRNISHTHLFLSYGLLVSFFGPAFLSLFDIHPFGHVRYQAYFYISFLFSSALGVEILVKKIFSYFLREKFFEDSNVFYAVVVGLFVVSSSLLLYKISFQRKTNEIRRNVESEQVKFLQENKDLPWVLQNYSLVYLGYYGFSKKDQVYRIRPGIQKKLKDVKEFVLITDSKEDQGNFQLPPRFKFSDIGLAGSREKYFVLAKCVSQNEESPDKKKEGLSLWKKN